MHCAGSSPHAVLNHSPRGRLQALPARCVLCEALDPAVGASLPLLVGHRPVAVPPLFRIQPRGRARRRAGRGLPDMHRAGSTFMLADGPRFPSSSTAPTPGAVRLARSSTLRGHRSRNRAESSHPSQRTARNTCPAGGALFPNQASCRVLRPRLDTRSHRGIPDRIGEALPGTAPFLQHASRAIGHRDGAASSSASSWAPSVAPALFPNMPPANPVARRSTDTKRRARRPLSRHCSSNYRRRSGLRPLSLARRPSARPMESAAPGDPVPNNPASTSSCCGEHQALARCPFYRIHEWRRARHPAYSTGHDPPSTRLARRLSLVLSARGEGRRGTSR